MEGRCDVGHTPQGFDPSREGALTWWPWKDGERKRKAVARKTRREVTEELREVQHRIEQGEAVMDDRRRRSDWLDEWLEQVVRFGAPSHAQLRRQGGQPPSRPEPRGSPFEPAPTETMIHSDDIRQATGRSRRVPPEHVARLLSKYMTTGAPVRGKERVHDLRVRATDVNWTDGGGPEVEGLAFDLLLAIGGRSGALANCEGDGVEVLLGRCR